MWKRLKAAATVFWCVSWHLGVEPLPGTGGRGWRCCECGREWGK